MPLTPTKYYNLFKPEGTDLFKRTDFNATWDVLDTSPGIYITTFGNPPSWGLEQNGRMMYETDSRRLLTWSGSGWVEPTFAPKVFAGSGVWTSTQSGGTSIPRPMVSFTTLRSCTLAIITTIMCTADGTGQIQWSNWQYLDNVSLQMSSAESLCYPGGIGTTATDIRQSTSLCFRAISAGNHVIFNQTQTAASSNSIVVNNWKMLAFMAQG